jgi:ribonuclease M5
MIPVFIVEGWSDHDKLQSAFGSVLTIVTNGTKVNRRLRNQINKRVDQGYTPFILSDPDEAGDHLARMIWGFYPSIPRIEVDPRCARYYKGGNKYKYGIEYCSHKYLQELLGGYLNVV